MLFSALIPIIREEKKLTPFVQNTRYTLGPSWSKRQKTINNSTCSNGNLKRGEERDDGFLSQKNLCMENRIQEVVGK